MNTSDLIAIAYRYYPCLGNPGDFSPPAWEAAWNAAPETCALRIRQESAVRQLDEWRVCLLALQQELPECIVQDRTYLAFDTCHTASVFISETSNMPLEKTVIVYASIIAPVYLMYEIHYARQENEYKVVARLQEPTPAACSVFEAVRGQIEMRYKFEPMSLESAEIPLEGMYLPLGAATLGDALFTTNRR